MGISIVLILISTCVSLKTLRKMSKNETIPLTQETSRSSVKSDNVYKFFKLNPFTIRPPNRAPQPTSRPRPNNRGGYPPVSEMDQLTTSGVDGAQPTTPATVSGTTTEYTRSRGISGVAGEAQHTTSGMVSGTATKYTTFGEISSVDETQSTIPNMVPGTTTKTKPGINTLVPVTPVVSTSRRWIRW